MRPAIYLLREGKRKVISMSPTLFGLLVDDDGRPKLVVHGDSFPVRGSVSDFIAEQERSMRESSDGDAYCRLADLFRDEARELLADIQAEIVEGQAVMVWPDGRYKLVKDNGDIDNDTEEIEGINIVDEGVFVYGYNEIQMWGNLVDELIQNFVDSI
jgi:hypothetical protein